MYGLTRGTTTLLGAAVAGALVWAATKVSGPSVGDYWAVIGILAAAGLVMALSQLLGGWTKWGWPRISLSVLLVGFVPTLIAAGWVILYAQPSANWFQRHIASWSGSIGIDGVVTDLSRAAVVLAFGLGLVFGFIFDTTGPGTEREPLIRRRVEAGPAPVPSVPARTADTEATRVNGREDTAETRVGATRELPPER